MVLERREGEAGTNRGEKELALGPSSPQGMALINPFWINGRAPLIHLQVQIEQKGQTGEWFGTGRHDPITNLQPRVTAVCLAGMNSSHPTVSPKLAFPPEHIANPVESASSSISSDHSSHYLDGRWSSNFSSVKSQNILS